MKALITGITGQDGSFLAELLLIKGYEVHGLVRRLRVPNTDNIRPIVDELHLLEGDLMDQFSLNVAVKRADPDEVYNLRGDASKANRVLGWGGHDEVRGPSQTHGRGRYEAPRVGC